MANAVLTSLIVSPGDLKRVRRELETVDEFLRQANLRQGGRTVQLPPTSRMLQTLVEDNKLNLLKVTDRERLKKYLTLLIGKAPVLHMSFASEPSAAFMSKIVVWIRDSIHPQAVINIGLQPSITAGCVLRTANKQFDFSLRQSFEDKRSLLAEALKSEEAAK